MKIKPYSELVKELTIDFASEKDIERQKFWWTKLNANLNYTLPANANIGFHKQLPYLTAVTPNAIFLGHIQSNTIGIRNYNDLVSILSQKGSPRVFFNTDISDNLLRQTTSRDEYNIVKSILGKPLYLRD